MKKKKNNGNVLQITLILLFMLSLNIFSLCHLTILNSRGFQSIKQTNDIRLLKNILIANYKYENQNSILLSNYLELENYTISYTVDDMGDYFSVVVDCGQFKEIAKCKSLASAKRWVATHLTTNDSLD